VGAVGEDSPRSTRCARTSHEHRRGCRRRRLGERLAAIRSLGRAGIRVLAVDHRRARSGSARSTRSAALARSRSTDEHRFVNFIRALGEAVSSRRTTKCLNAIARYATTSSC
jgi:hypothetical protein